MLHRATARNGRTRFRCALSAALLTPALAVDVKKTAACVEAASSATAVIRLQVMGCMAS